MWLVECRRIHIQIGKQDVGELKMREGVGGGGGESMRSRQEKVGWWW